MLLVRWDIKCSRWEPEFCEPRQRPWLHWRWFSMRSKGEAMEIINPPDGEAVQEPMPAPPPPEPLTHPAVQPAGFFRRVLAFIIDIFILQCLYLIIIIV